MKLFFIKIFIEKHLIKKAKIIAAQRPTPISRMLSEELEKIIVDSIFAASEFEERYQLFFWDASIVAAACNANAEKILTEELNRG